MSNGNRTEWSQIRSVITRVITKSDNRPLQTELDDTKTYYQLIIEITISEKKKDNQVMKERKICIKVLTKEA